MMRSVRDRLAALERRADANRWRLPPRPAQELDDDQLDEILQILHEIGQLQAVLGAELAAALIPILEADD